MIGRGKRAIQSGRKEGNKWKEGSRKCNRGEKTCKRKREELPKRRGNGESRVKEMK